MRLRHLAGIALAPSAKPETNSKPLDIFFFGSNLFLGDGRFNEPPERQAWKLSASGASRWQGTEASLAKAIISAKVARPGCVSCAVTAALPTAR
jgi:hypothetical protein